MNTTQPTSSRTTTTSISIYSLPNELLIHLLSYTSSRTLFRLTTVSRRIHSLIIRILHHRLLACTSLEDENLIFECYHPSERATSPHRECDYLGTDIVGRWDGAVGDRSNSNGNSDDGPMMMTRLVEMYSHFRPRQREGNNKGTLVLGISGSEAGQTSSSSSTTTSNGRFQVLRTRDSVVEHISFEPHELFSQLCTAAHLVTHGPRSGFFRSFVTISEGTARVWRDWLADRASGSSSYRDDSYLSNGSSHPSAACSGDEGILWIDTRRNLGMRVRVRERKWVGDQPILIRQDESPPASYSVEIEEVLLRTSHLLLMREESLETQNNQSGKAVVFGSFR